MFVRQCPLVAFEKDRHPPEQRNFLALPENSAA
jgi:hypothetical protein